MPLFLAVGEEVVALAPRFFAQSNKHEKSDHLKNKTDKKEEKKNKQRKVIFTHSLTLQLSVLLSLIVVLHH